MTQRELRETLADWRIVLPIGLLTFVLPLIVLQGIIFVITFVQDAQVATGLLPFGLLLVGFVPASFSIVVALESFVGERERNTLEALLAAPITDKAIYLSKLYASLALPLLSSSISMLIFIFMLYASRNDMYFGSFTLERLLLLFLIVGAMAVVMVASAVVISSHITSIRAANLMSSFILLPAAVLVQINAVLIITGRWEGLLFVLLALLTAAAVLVERGLRAFNRESILSREHMGGSLFGHRAPPAPADALAVPAAAPTLLPADAHHRRHEPPVPRRALLTVVRRELGETLTDWRVLLPVFVLTFIVPVLLVAGTNFAIQFVGDPRQIAQVVPFAILLVGFIPASFSLITALESFVGERERGSLESLLAMPISDHVLYASKVGSSLVVPLLTSYSAMLFFSGLMWLFFPGLLFDAMTALYFVQLMLMISVMALVMVAGAVIISSHTGSIRAANLLASFILIPITVAVAVQFPFFIGERWDLVRILMACLFVVALALMRTGVMTFNREEILSRENEQLNIRRTLQHFRLCFAEYQPAGVPFGAYAGAAFSLRRFYRHELPALLRELRLPLLLALLAALSGALIGGYVGMHYYAPQWEGFLSQIGNPPDAGPGLALGVLFNNLRVSIFSTLLSLLALGVFAALVPFVALGQVGLISGVLTLRGGSWLALDAASPLQFLLAYVVPHGIIELPTFVVSTALGIRLGAAVLSPPASFSVGQNIIWALANICKVWLLVLLPLIVLAALIEGFVTPLVVLALYAG
jgi:uncharacterized membrane protein SpoIIM required for sporulation/ABC-type Na+ efflux pump permease subunit